MLSPGVPGQGMNPFVIERGDSEELSATHRKPEKAHRGDGGRESRRGAKGRPGPLPGGLLRPAPRAHRLPGLLRLPRKETRREAEIWRSCCGPSPRAACATCSPTRGTTFCRGEALITVFDLRLLEPELRPAAAMVCTETVWAAAAQDPQTPAAGRGRGVEHHAAPRGRGLHGELWQSGRRKHRLGLQFITQDVQDLLSEDSSRAITGHSGRALLLQNAAFKLLLAAGRRRHQHGGRRLRPSGGVATLAAVLPQG